MVASETEPPNCDILELFNAFHGHAAYLEVVRDVVIF